MEPRKSTRREFLRQSVTTAAALAVGGVDLASAQQERNVFQALDELCGEKQIDFVVQTEHGSLPAGGRPVSQKLKGVSGGNPLTMTFGFKNCDQICPMTDANLKLIGDNFKKAKAGLTSVVISIQPHKDAGGITPDDAFMRKLKGNGEGEFSLQQNVVILYPTRNGQLLNDDEAQKIMADFSLQLGSRHRPQLHSPDIYLYDGSGNLQDKQNGMGDADNFKDWPSRVKSSPGQSQHL